MLADEAVDDQTNNWRIMTGRWMVVWGLSRRGTGSHSHGLGATLATDSMVTATVTVLGQTQRHTPAGASFNPLFCLSSSARSDLCIGALSIQLYRYSASLLDSCASHKGALCLGRIVADVSSVCFPRCTG
jgi:hypothetical protein